MEDSNRFSDCFRMDSTDSLGLADVVSVATGIVDTWGMENHDDMDELSKIASLNINHNSTLEGCNDDDFEQLNEGTDCDDSSCQQQVR